MIFWMRTNPICVNCWQAKIFFSEVNKAWTLKGQGPEPLWQGLELQDQDQGRNFVDLRPRLGVNLKILRVFLHSCNCRNHGMFIFTENYAFMGTEVARKAKIHIQIASFTPQLLGQGQGRLIPWPRPRKTVTFIHFTPSLWPRPRLGVKGINVTSNESIKVTRYQCKPNMEKGYKLNKATWQ